MKTIKKLSFLLLSILCLLVCSATVMAQSVWTKHTGTPVLTVGSAGEWDSKYVESGAVVFDNGAYRMWYSGSDGSSWAIGCATSPDGITWTKNPGNPVLRPGDKGTWDDAAVFSPSIIYDNGIFQMWYSGEGAFTKIGYATSPDGVMWTKNPGNPVLDLSVGANTWENGGVYYASVLQVGGQYKMWYTGFCTLATSTIGYAESSDGVTWTKYLFNPVLENGVKGAWDDYNVESPNVVFDGFFYHMWYCAWHKDFPLLDKGFYKIGYARSTDGLTWNKYDNNPVLKQGGRLFTGWDGRGVLYPIVIFDGSQYKMWYTGRGRFGYAYHEQIGYATSPVDAQ